MDLAEFVAARLDEDQYLVSGFAFTGDTKWDAEMLGRLFWYGDGSAPKFRPADDPVIRHLARHDAARVLREVAAKRAILAAYEAVLADCHSAGVPARRPRKYGEYDGLHKAVAELAAVYSDHPDYQQEWAP